MHRKESFLVPVASFATFSIAVIPLVWVAGVFTFALRAYWSLGYWPTPSHPEPKALSYDLHYIVVFLGSVLVRGSLAALPTLRLCSMNVVPRDTWLRAKYIYFLGWGLILVFFFAPKLNFINWFLD